MIEHLKHMARVRPDGLDKDAAWWAFNEITRLRAECIRLEDHINDADDESIRLRAKVERLTAALSWIQDLAPDITTVDALQSHARAALAGDGK